MRISFLLLWCSLLVSCSTKRPVPNLAHPGCVLPAEYFSQDSSLGLRLRVDRKQSRYELFSPATGARLASGSSAIVTLDFSENVFRGTVDVTFAKDGSGVVITENLSDAGPMLRYILFHRLDNGSFQVHYLNPPTIFSPRRPLSAFSAVHPYATELTAERIMFYYPGIRQSKIMLLRDVSTTPTLEPQ